MSDEAKAPVFGLDGRVETDKEIEALGMLTGILQALPDDAARERVLAYVRSRCIKPSAPLGIGSLDLRYAQQAQQSNYAQQIQQNKGVG